MRSVATGEMQPLETPLTLTRIISTLSGRRLLRIMVRGNRGRGRFPSGRRA